MAHINKCIEDLLRKSEIPSFDLDWSWNNLIYHFSKRWQETLRSTCSRLGAWCRSKHLVRFIQFLHLKISHDTSFSLVCVVKRRNSRWSSDDTTVEIVELSFVVPAHRKSSYYRPARSRNEFAWTVMIILVRWAINKWEWIFKNLKVDTDVEMIFVFRIK